MSFVRDLETLFSAPAVGVVANKTMFASTAADLPTGPGPLLVIIRTHGVGESRTQNQPTTASQRHPGAQIVAEAKDYEAAEALAEKAWAACLAVKNTVVNGTKYLEIRPTQEPGDLGVNTDTNRVRVGFNVLGWHT